MAAPERLFNCRREPPGLRGLGNELAIGAELFTRGIRSLQDLGSEQGMQFLIKTIDFNPCSMSVPTNFLPPPGHVPDRGMTYAIGSPVSADLLISQLFNS